MPLPAHDHRPELPPLSPDGESPARLASWQRFKPMVLRLLRFTLGAETDVEGLAQEVFFRAFAKAKTPFVPWAMRKLVLTATIEVCFIEDRRRLGAPEPPRKRRSRKRGGAGARRSPVRPPG